MENKMKLEKFVSGQDKCINENLRQILKDTCSESEKKFVIDWVKKSLCLKWMKEAKQQKAYRKCEKCDELFNQEDNEINERDEK